VLDLRLITESASTEEFAEAMSTLASGVVIVTCRVDGRPWGMTVTAFASISADPPTVLVSLRSDAPAALAIGSAQSFGVSILAEGQLGVAHLGSKSDRSKFLEQFTGAREASSASPAVAGALAHLDCEVLETVEIADHTVFFGRVRAARSSQAGAPLLYHRRTYRTLFPTERTTTCRAN